MKQIDYRKEIDDFEAHYGYDTKFMRELLDSSPQAYQKFADMLPLARHRDVLSPDVYWVAKLATMQAQDCGDCLQLNVRMALEDGVSRQLVEKAIKKPAELPEDLQEIHQFATAVAANELREEGLIERMEKKFTKAAILELGLCIASAGLFPTIKRTLGYTRSCSLIEIEIQR